MTIPARYENGVFRPLVEVTVDEGTIVEIVIPSPPAVQSSPRSLRDFEFCGMWQDRRDMADSVDYINRLRGDLRG